MRRWTDNTDPASIPDVVLTSEYKRRLGAKGQLARKTKGGGRPLKCTCGACATCVRRAKRQKGETK